MLVKTRLAKAPRVAQYRGSSQTRQERRSPHMVSNRRPEQQTTPRGDLGGSSQPSLGSRHLVREGARPAAERQGDGERLPRAVSGDGGRLPPR